MLKKILIGLGVGFIIIQFIRPERNLSDDLTYDISTKYSVPENVSGLLKNACYDCHSNKTEYPWYAYIQPVNWWVNKHIVDGKRHFNFSDFTGAPVARQNRRLEEAIEQIERNEMPLESYTYLGLHKEANLTDEQKEIIIGWARAQMELLKATYPADSLIMRRRPRAQPDT